MGSDLPQHHDRPRHDDVTQHNDVPEHNEGSSAHHHSVETHHNSRDARHRRWAVTVAVVAFTTLIGSAGLRSVPGVLMDPLHQEFGWSHGTIGAAVSINLVLFGLISPFAAALMDRFGVRRGVLFALLAVALGRGPTI